MRSDNAEVNALFVPLDQAGTHRVWKRVRDGLGISDARFWLLCKEIVEKATLRRQLDTELPSSVSLKAVLPDFAWEGTVYFINVHFGKCFVADGQKVMNLAWDDVWYPSADVLLIVSDLHPTVALVEDFGRVSMARMNGPE